MTIGKAELWRNGKFITHCRVRKDGSGAQFIEDTDQPVPDADDYEVRSGDAIEKVARVNAEWRSR